MRGGGAGRAERSARGAPKACELPVFCPSAPRARGNENLCQCADFDFQAREILFQALLSPLRALTLRGGGNHRSTMVPVTTAAVNTSSRNSLSKEKSSGGGWKRREKL